jgi:3-oxosteroid 1-dehydrogenase
VVESYDVVVLGTGAAGLTAALAAAHVGARVG